jgi:hypothetical protein
MSFVILNVVMLKVVAPEKASTVAQCHKTLQH